MKGDKVRVVRGRKVPLGTEGVVIWVGEGHWGTRLGVKDAGGEVHWTAATNVELVETASGTPPVFGVPSAEPFVPPAWAYKGAKVTLTTGEAGEVFWVGEDKRNPGKVRVGVREPGYRGYGRAPAKFVGEEDLVFGTTEVAA